jgi:hypothetical protein
MNEIDKKEPPEVSGGYMPRPGDIPCTDPPGFPDMPQIPGLPLPGPWPADPPERPAPLF